LTCIKQTSETDPETSQRVMAAMLEQAAVTA
jgi:hypothetical protein